mgnify:CR=1 FL=1
MSSEPNIKLTERLWGGRPKGWGSSLPNTSQAGTNPQPQGPQRPAATGQQLPKPFRQKPLWIRIWINLLAGAGILFVALVILVFIASPLVVG